MLKMCSREVGLLSGEMLGIMVSDFWDSGKGLIAEFAHGIAME